MHYSTAPFIIIIILFCYYYRICHPALPLSLSLPPSVLYNLVT